MTEKLAGVSTETFIYHRPTEDQLAVLTKWRDHCRQMQANIADDLPDSAELTLAMRKLEEFNMWLNKAIVISGVK